MKAKAKTKVKVKVKANISNVEKYFLGKSSYKEIYPPQEKIAAVVVENFPMLGKFAALRFLEWVQNNPGGVISLPTGKTPEHFIKWVQRLLRTWDNTDTKALLEDAGLNPSVKPDMKSLRFVQIDEFYPISPYQQNSFYNYVKKFYIEGFGLDVSKALLINCEKIALNPDEKLTTVWPEGYVDLKLRYCQPKTFMERRQAEVIHRIDQWCMEYEDKIRSMGGIGFFLGGIGPDGHIGFNISGSDHHSTTRLCPINYETQAAAATDLGGVEIARKSLVITIGLDTITYNPECTAIIIAAGAAKAQVVTRAIETEHDINIPGTALHKLPNAKFYLTQGAASQLSQRRLVDLQAKGDMTPQQIEQILIDISVKNNKPLIELSVEDCKNDQFGAVLINKYPNKLSEFAAMTRDNIIAKIDRGIKVAENKRFLHTEPHHDDVMLGYFARIVRHSRQASNTHYFTTMTSGFTSVTNRFMKEQLVNLKRFIRTREFRELFDKGYFEPDNKIGKNRDIWQYLDGVASNSQYIKEQGAARRLLRNMVEVFEDHWLENLEDRISELEEYFERQYPGKQDPDFIQKLKGMCREWEAECLWGYFGWNCDNVMHLRLGFYTGDIFTKDPTMDTDVPPIVHVLEKVKPNVVTVAFDPEGSGPDTHYKVLQATAEALKIYQKQTGNENIDIWGYRNVWYKYDLAEANVFVPVSLNMFAIMQDAFMNSFASQRNASFPSYQHDGPFSELAQKIQVEQYHKIKTCLGRQWFNEHPSALLRATRGMVFLKEMTTSEFYKSCRELQKSIES